MKRLIPFLIIAAVLGSAVTMFWFLRQPDVAKQQRIGNQTRSISPGADPPHVLGSSEAPVMIEEFGDFECPPCASLHPVLKSMKNEFGSRLVIVFREFPIVATHKHAMTAARAAEAAAMQGKFWEMHDLLYANQNEWKNASDAGPVFEKYAQTLGLAIDRFKTDVASDLAVRRIALDKERGYSIGVNSTPTVFMNGREVPAESLSTEGLRGLIQSQISEDK